MYAREKGHEGKTYFNDYFIFKSVDKILNQVEHEHTNKKKKNHMKNKQKIKGTKFHKIVFSLYKKREIYL